jgi:hypothetical protein
MAAIPYPPTQSGHSENLPNYDIAALTLGRSGHTANMNKWPELGNGEGATNDRLGACNVSRHAGGPVRQPFKNCEVQAALLCSAGTKRTLVQAARQGA